jgi:hypothetical protein
MPWAIFKKYLALHSRLKGLEIATDGSHPSVIYQISKDSFLSGLNRPSS